MTTINSSFRFSKQKKLPPDNTISEEGILKTLLEKYKPKGHYNLKIISKKKDQMEAA